MIRCRICEREHEPFTAVCECGADLAIDGVAVGSDARFGDLDLGGDLPELGDLPDLDVAGPSEVGDSSDTVSIPAVDHAAAPLPPPEPDPPVEPPPVEPPRAEPPPRRGFAVQPSAGSGEPHRGEPRSTTEDPEPQPRLAPVPTAPVVDETLANSVFSDEATDREWRGAGALRDELSRARGEVVTCPACGRDVEAGRRFCRCGHQLVTTIREPTAPLPEPGRLTSFWRRISGTGRDRHSDQRSWGQRARDTGARRGMRYATRLSGRTRIGRMGMLLGGGAGLLLVLGPLRNEVRDLPNLFDAPQPEEITGWSPGPCDGPALDVAGNPWQTEWPAPAPGEPEVDAQSCPGTFDAIEGSFAEPTDVDRLTVEIGPTSGQAEFNRGQPVMSPAVLELTFVGADEAEREIIRLDLEDTAASQEFAAKARDAVGFTLRIVEVREHSWPELPVVQIARIALFAG